MIDIITLLADGPLPDPTALSSPTAGAPDPLIDRGGQLAVYIGAALIVLGVTACVGFFSRRIEHTLITALALSLCVMAVLIATR